MRTTIDIPDELFRKAKIKAASEGVAFKDIVVRAIRLAIGEIQPEPGYRVKLPLIESKTPGVLTSEMVKQAMADMDEEEDMKIARFMRRERTRGDDGQAA